ncbi:membrane hypothetical protein [Mesorhizobium sp. ORS 3359]|nr:membrane hypothetical protein [Mesorhizobium sp. ORS 3359]
MNELVREPGFWAAVTLVVFSVSHFVAAAYVRRLRARMLTIIETILSEPSANAADKAWIQKELDLSSNKHHQHWVGFLAPVLFVGTLVVGLFDRRTAQDELSLQALLNEADNTDARAVKVLTGEDPRTGTFWKDKRRRKVSRLSWAITDLSSPFASLWVYFWLGSAIATLSVFWGVSSAIVFVARRSASVTNIPTQIAWHYMKKHHA